MKPQSLIPAITEIPTPLCNNIDIDAAGTTEYAHQILWFLILFLLALYPRPAYSNGIGIQNFSGDITISNSFFRGNFNGIRITTTNAASIANNTIDNLWIFSNDIHDSERHGIYADFSDAGGGITVRNNSLDNKNVPHTGDNTVNGYNGIGIRNNISPSIANNTVSNFGRSGIRLQNIPQVTVVNNILYSNGTQDYTVGNEHFASGLQATNSTFVNVSYNIITSNRFSGIAVSGTGGTIGPGNTIKYDGDPDLASGGWGGLENCAVTAGARNLRGGVLVRDLALDQEMTVMCTNTITSNYHEDIATAGTGGTVYSCGNAVIISYASPDDAVYYYNGSSGHVVHDCNNSTINAAIDKGAPVPFGIIIEGSSSDVTVQNCTIKNAAMEKQYTATIGNGNIIGAGIFISRNATPLISGNYIFSNGWALLDDRIYTEAGASGIQLRCAEAQTSIVNNIIASNANAGLVGRETGGVIGALNKANTFRNNAGSGIGFYDGTLRNLVVAYNTIYNSKRGIGALNFDGTFFNIANNFIFSNQGTASYAGGIKLREMNGASASVTIENNTIRNNTGTTSGGIGLFDPNGNFEGTVSIMNNRIYNNTATESGAAGVGARGIKDSAVIRIEGNTISNNNCSGSAGSGGLGFTATSSTNITVLNNSLYNNSAPYAGGVGIIRTEGALTFKSNTIFNNTSTNSGGGGFGLNDLYSSARIYFLDNFIYGNTGDRAGGIGLVKVNSDNIHVNNNSIYNNSGDDAGAIGVTAGNGTLSFMNNTIYSNKTIAFGAGAFAFNALSSANVQLEGNEIYDNIGSKAGAISFISPDSNSTIRIIGNSIYNNTAVNNTFCVGGVGVTMGNGTISLMNNEILRNTSLGSGSGGIGFRKLSSTATVWIESNTINNNDGWKAAGIGLWNESAITTVNFYIYSNTLFNNNQSGIAADYVQGFTIENNWIISNGLDNFMIGNERYASGIQIRNSSITNGSVVDNTIRNNRFAGIQVYNSEGYIGPDNIMRYNGDTEAVGCNGLSGPGSGDGAVAVRDLDITDTLIVSANVIEDNNIGTVTRRDCNGTVRNNGVDAPCGYWEQNDAVIFITEDNIVVSNQTVSGGNVWGIAVVGGAKGVVIKNCTIENNMTQNMNTGGGILVGPGVEAQIYSNVIRNNGYTLANEGFGGNAGVVLRCAEASTVLKDNIIYSNKSDGVDSRDSDSTIGASGARNFIYNNGRLGIGIRGSGNPNIGYNDIYRNNSGGIGLYELDGAVNIYSNYIYSNTGSSMSQAGGIGLRFFSGTASIRDNTITGNKYTDDYDYPAGIGVLEPLGGTITIADNIIASNESHSLSDVGGIGLRGASAASPGTLNNVYITSNRVSNHRYNAGNQSAIAFKWLDFGAMYIRNNTKDGLGLSNNAAGVRFHSLADGVDVRIKNNLIRDNVNPTDSGGVGIEFKNCNYIDVDIDNNIVSNSQWSVSGENKAVIAFDNCNQYSANYIKIRRNQINNTNEEGIHFSGIVGVSGSHVAKVSIGTSNESPGGSNNIINLPAEKRAIRFKDNTTGNIGVEIKNNDNVEGGIAFSGNKLFYLTIMGNANIFSGQKGTDPDSNYTGILAQNNVAGLRGDSMGNPVPITISNNGIKNNRDSGVRIRLAPVYADFAIEGNTIASNGSTGFLTNSATLMNSFIFSGNLVRDNGLNTSLEQDTETENGSGLLLSGGDPPSTSELVIANNTFKNNKINAVSLADQAGGGGSSIGFTGGRISSNSFINNQIRGFSQAAGTDMVIEYNLCYSNNGWRSTAPDTKATCLGLSGGSATISNNIIYSNAGIGIGVAGQTSPYPYADIYYNTIAYNFIGIRASDSSVGIIKNCIVWSNSNSQIPDPTGPGENPPPVNYSDVQGGYVGTGNIDQYPQFVSNSPPYDLHLADNSPCIDNGAAVNNITTDIDLDIRPYDDPAIANGGDGSANDMGADENLCSPMPDTPTNPSPNDNATCLAVNAILDWADSANADSYDVYYDTFSPATTLRTTVTQSQYDPPADFSNGTKYYWFVKAKNSSCESKGPEWNFTTIQVSNPGTPTNPSPANGALEVDTSTALSWSATSDTDSYEVYYDTYSPPTTLRSTVTTNSYITTNLTIGTIYYWKIVSKNCIGSTSSSIWTFTTSPWLTPLSATANGNDSGYPAGNAVDENTLTEWRYTGGMGGSLRWIYFDTGQSAQITAIRVYNTTGDTEITWRVDVSDDASNWTTIVSSWLVDQSGWEELSISATKRYIRLYLSSGDVQNDLYEFEYKPCTPPPGQPDIPSPDNGTTCVNVTAVLDWADADNADSYDVYYDTFSPPTTLRTTVTQSQYDPPGDLSNITQYYWYVETKNSSCDPNKGPEWNFTTIQTSDPGTPINPSPANGAQDVEYSTTLSWSATSDTDSYDVYYDTFSPPTTLRSTVTTNSYDPGGLNTSTQYYWKIISKNCLGSASGSTWNFTTSECNQSVCSLGCSYTTISAAMTAAVSGDTICVKNGSYSEGNLTIKSGVNVTGESNTGTVITGSTMYMDSNSTLDNLKLSYNGTRVRPNSSTSTKLFVTNCRFEGSANYGIRLDYTSNSSTIDWTIDSNVFSATGSSSVAIYSYSSDFKAATIMKNRFTNCYYGIYFGTSNSAAAVDGVIIGRNRISGTSTKYFGIRNSSSHTVSLRNNIIYGYSNSTYGYGYYQSAGTSYLYFNTIYGNRRGIYRSGGTATVKSSIIWGNSSYDLYSTSSGYLTVSDSDYSSSYRVTDSGGNINCNPQFVNPGAGDYQLQNISPCIDNATTITGVGSDYDGGNRSVDGPNESPPGCPSYGDTDTNAEPDMGADEYGSP